MAWDTSEPTDTTKIRSLGTVIRPNWVAIEEGDSTFKPEALNLVDRTASVVPIDPTAVAGATVLFSKQDDAGDPQLYSIDPSSTIRQITGNGSILAWCCFNGNNGNITSTGTFNVTSVTRNSQGNFTVTFTNALPHTEYGVQVCAEMQSNFTTGGICGFGGRTTTNCKVYTRSMTTVGGADLNPVSFMVIG